MQVFGEGVWHLGQDGLQIEECLDVEEEVVECWWLLYCTFNVS